MLIRLSMLKGADQCWFCIWLWFAEGPANTELLAINTLNACGSSHPEELSKNTSMQPKASFFRHEMQVASACPAGSRSGKTCL